MSWKLTERNIAISPISSIFRIRTWVRIFLAALGKWRNAFYTRDSTDLLNKATLVKAGEDENGRMDYLNWWLLVRQGPGQKLFGKGLWWLFSNNWKHWNEKSTEVLSCFAGILAFRLKFQKNLFGMFFDVCECCFCRFHHFHTVLPVLGCFIVESHYFCPDSWR